MDKKSTSSRVRERKRGGVAFVDGVPIERGSGNVFADLGLPNPDEHAAKAELAYEINRLLAGQTQAQAAALLGVDQPKISALRRGRLKEFSTERLLRFLIHLGYDVEIHILPARRRGRAAARERHLRVLAHAS